jgi:2-dehydro-3-deoxygluconokinase
MTSVAPVDPGPHGGSDVDVVTLGETMAAFRAATPLRLGGSVRLSIAGAESNVAIGLTRLGHSARWIGVRGADELGELVRRTLRREST